ncbi:MAG: ATP-dependent Clp protease ATP-binding subunit, partial [Geobacter sp.]
HRKYLKIVDFEVLVLEIPKDILDDKLTQLSGERGQISRSLYEDFMIATCVANVNQMLAYLNQRAVEPADLMKIRAELMDSILEVNPLLKADNLVINVNHVVKVKTGRKKKGEVLLTENKSWDVSYYDDLVNVSAEIERKMKELEDNSEAPPKTEEGDVENLDAKIVKKWWKRINQYVNIKEFSPKDVESILKKRFFHNRSSFETFIVSVCVDEYEDLFNMLDDLGIPKTVAPPILMHELYELCRSVNEFLTFKNAQDIADKTIVEEPESDESTPFGGNALKNSVSKVKKNAPKRMFKDVPKEDILRLGDNMKVFLIGQDEAVNTVTDAIQRSSVGLKDPNKPLGSFLFAGRTGVGKTLASKVLADELIKGSKDNIITIDCSEYTADHEYSKLIGAPAGYVGHEHGGMLTNALSRNPFSVVVFDEIEKASYKVHQLLLQILEEGRLTDGKGKAVPFRDAVIVMTSNVGVSEVEAVQKTIGFGDVCVLTEDKKNLALTEALKKKFKPEFLNRIDAIVNFRNLVKKDYMRIIDIELYKLGENMKTNDSLYKDVELVFDDKVRDFVYDKGINEEYGARPLKRFIEKEISTPLARRLLNAESTADTVVEISTDGEAAIFTFKDKPSSPPFYMLDEGKKEAV